ncbi:hypothetical protein P5P86_15825 [Nocardioides sp. BP30]|uniref:hypothetical protein n=1 Tax=Nocardioides sp. BP30 TaxID=3036374 RepID=UPI0024688970|nr:hypothetical protein [Nocardioides sp. BP30]WGL51422.1 hypothetical protein P5P86_15825 [Nocardioides sp. BP30]
MSESGLLFAPMTATMLSAGMAAGRLTRPVDAHRLVATTSMLSVLAYLSAHQVDRVPSERGYVAMSFALAAAGAAPTSATD